jgi:hypothetical protein
LLLVACRLPSICAKRRRSSHNLGPRG